MKDCNSLSFSFRSHIAIREVYRMCDISILEKIFHLCRSHFSTVIFRLLCRCTKMRNHDRASDTDYLFCREVRYVAAHFLRYKRVYDVFLIHKNISGKIQNNNAFFHKTDGVFVDHTFCIFQRRHMNCNIITLFINFICCFRVMNIARQSPCRINRNIWIISINFHSKMNGCICHKNTYRAKTYNAKFFPFKFCSCEYFFLFLCDLCNIAILFVFLNPVDSSDNISCCQKHSRNHKFFYAVCVCSRRIEYNNPFFGTAFKRYIIHTCARTGDHFQVFIKLHLVHLCASHKNSVCSFCSLHIHIIFIQLIKSYCRNWI